ncbi:MAG: hypothetical protein H7Y42_14680 [Chitinophagaceae bacterium]|nr:hypothetical protein [Chitinophagaceae bacterium]
MNKKLLFKLCLVAVLAVSANSAFASITASSSISGAISVGGGSYSPSKSVKVFALSTDTTYAATSGHTSGDRTIATNNSDPKMYYSAKATSADPAAPGNATASFTSWTSL